MHVLAIIPIEKISSPHKGGYQSNRSTIIILFEIFYRYLAVEYYKVVFAVKTDLTLRLKKEGFFR